MQLSQDHRPVKKNEEWNRVENAGGVIHPFVDKDGNLCGPERVWVKKKGYPGLSTSRSFGDMQSRKIGITHGPFIKSTKIEPEDKCILIGSDGIFEYQSN